MKTLSSESQRAACHACTRHCSTCSSKQLRPACEVAAAVPALCFIAVTAACAASVGAAPVLHVEAAEVVAGLLRVVDILKHHVRGAARLLVGATV